MTERKPTREEAWELLQEYVQDEALIKHSLAVEGVLGHFAEKFGEEDPEKWRVIGLIHDLDYEKYPREHCQKTGEILTEKGWPQDYIRAVMSHGWKMHTQVEPRERMEKVLYTIDELTGLVAATTLMRPGQNIMDLKAKSVKKKWKQKGFAAGVNREVIAEGAQMLEMDLEEIIEETIQGMQRVAEELSLKGNLKT